MNQNEQQPTENKDLNNIQMEEYKKMIKTKLLAEIVSKDKQLKEVEDSLKKIKDELEKIRESEKSYKEQLIRMQADFENYKKREEKKKQEFMEYAKQDLICQLLSIIDNLERATSYTEDSPNEKHFENIKEGLKGILKDFRNILEKEGLKPIKALGEKFDPYCHEAITQVESEKFPEDTIIEELIKGYYLKAKVLRPSIVKVSKGSTEKQGETTNKTRKITEDNAEKNSNTNNK